MWAVSRWIFIRIRLIKAEQLVSFWLRVHKTASRITDKPANRATGEKKTTMRENRNGCWTDRGNRSHVIVIKMKLEEKAWCQVAPVSCDWQGGKLGTQGCNPVTTVNRLDALSGNLETFSYSVQSFFPIHPSGWQSGTKTRFGIVRTEDKPSFSWWCNVHLVTCITN